MTQKRFEKKFQEIIKYEDNVYDEILDFIKPYNEELNKIGYEIICRRSWEYMSREESQKFSMVRLPFNKRESYGCTLLTQFQLLGYDPDADEGVGFQIIERMAAYGLSFFTGWSFSKYKIKYTKKNILESVEMIKAEGLEKIARMLLKKDKEWVKEHPED